MTREELIRIISKVPKPYVINPVVKFYAEGQLREYEQQIRAEVIEEVFGKIEERLNDSTTVTFDLPVEEVLGEDVDMDDFIMLAEEIVQEYKNLIFSKLKQAKKQLKEQMQKGTEQ